MKDAVIVSAVRTAVGKAPKGTLRNTRPDEMGAAVIKEALSRVPSLDVAEIEDVIMGCAMPEAEQGMNVARAAAIRAGLPVETSAMTINRFCSSGLNAVAIAAVRPGVRTKGPNQTAHSTTSPSHEVHWASAPAGRAACGKAGLSLAPVAGSQIRPVPS